MADRTSSSIEIAATPDQVMAVIADFPRYPEWADSISSAQVLAQSSGRAEQVELVLEHPLLKDRYVLAYDWEPARVTWRLVRGRVLKAMDGSYDLAPAGDATTVTYTLSVDANVPMMGLLRRKAEKTIIDGALRGLKRRVEG